MGWRRQSYGSFGGPNQRIAGMSKRSRVWICGFGVRNIRQEALGRVQSSLLVTFDSPPDPWNKVKCKKGDAVA